MKFKERIPKELFTDTGKYLGKPAEFEDKIITRRVEILKTFKGFTGKNYKLLDIGCGNGATMKLLAPGFKSITGIDIVDFYKPEFDALGIKNCEYKVADILHELPHEMYNRIISFETIEHLDVEDLSYFANSIYKGGLLAVTVPNKWWIFETHGAKLPLLPWNRVPFFSWLPRPIHERFANARIYTKKRIEDLLEDQGFKVLRCEYVMAPMDVLPKGKFKDLIIKLFFKKNTTNIPFKSTSIFVIARRISGPWEPPTL